MDIATRHVDVLLYEGVNILDVAGPAQVFHLAMGRDGPGYLVRFLTMDGAPVSASCGLRLMADGCDVDPTADLVVPGGDGVDQAMEDVRITGLVGAWRDRQVGTRLISICSGALLLAKAGVLNGRAATTHWARGVQAQRQFPEVRWDTNQLYFIDPDIMTSAGVTSGIDLALAIVRRDLGDAAALRVAREIVVYLQRTGGQDQFADLLEAQFSGDQQLGRLIDALIRCPAEAWTLDRMADLAGLTPRTLTRRFSSTFDQSPVKFLERLRVKRATDAISSGAPLDRVVAKTGFSDFQQMQRAFKRQIGTTVGAYQRRFSGPVQGGEGVSPAGG